MMTQGLQNLINFRDNLQQEMPEPTGLDKLSLLQNLTMNSMAENSADNQLMVTPQQYFASGGLVSLPVVQAGFGGFLKKIASIPKKVFKAVKRVAKSPLGKLAITAAPMFLGLPPVFANPAANAAFWSGGTTLLTGGKPEDALKAAVLSGGLTGLTQGFSTPQGAKGIFSSGQATKAGLGGATSSYTGGPSDLTNLSYGDAFQPVSTVGDVAAQQAAGVGTSQIPGFTGDIGSATYGGVGQAQAASSALQGPGGIVSPESGISAFQDPSLMQYPGGAPQEVAGSINFLDKTKDALMKGVQYAKDNPFKTAMAAGVGLSALSAGQQIPQQQLDMAGLTPVETDFDKQIFTYRDMQGNILDRDQALQMIQTASQNFGEGGKKVASGVTYGYDRVDDADKVLTASGGLIGMAYGGQMPMNNLDVKYKEFSGMVGGQGDGMEDNVYMPIVDKEAGQQVATLAVSPKEYVVDANTMSLLGNGNPDAGAKIMDQTVKDVRMAATGQAEQQKEIDGLEALNRMRRSV